MRRAFCRFRHYVLDYIRYLYYLAANDRFRFNVARYRKCTDRKDFAVIKKEMSVLRKYWGCIPMQYYTHDFYRKDCLLSLEEMKSYIPSYYFYFVVYPKYDNLKGVRYVLENKITCLFLFRGMGLPCPDTMFFKKDGRLYWPSGKKVDRKDFEKHMGMSDACKVFVKPVSGCGGKGIKILDRVEGSGYCFEGKKVDLSTILGFDGDYVIESKISQVSYLNDVYPHSVNTLRAVTCRRNDGSVELVGVTLRMGCDGRQVDNSAQGGLLIGIDLKSGLPIRPYAGYEYGSEKKYEHPDTGYKFGDLEIKDWESVRVRIIEFAEKMALYNLIGWDIALTNDGPIVIEANTKFGLDHSQSGVGGMKDFFVVGLPSYY